MRGCQLSWRCERRVSPHSCLAMRWAPCALCAAVVELTFFVRLNVLKPSLHVQSLKTASALHCDCFRAGLRALISGAEIWQSQQVMTEAVVRSHPEPQRRLTFQADGAALSNTHNTKALITGVWLWCCFPKMKLFSCHRHRHLFYVYWWRMGVSDIFKLLNFFKDTWLPIWDNCTTASPALETPSSCYLIVAVTSV